MSFGHPVFLLVAVELLTKFSSLLSLKRERCGRAGEKTRNTDRIAGFFTPAVFAVFESAQRLLNFFKELAFSVTGSQLKCMFFFDRGTVCRIGNNVRLSRRRCCEAELLFL